MKINNSGKSSKNYICDSCNFVSYNKKDFNRHLSTSKHMNNINKTTNNITIKDNKTEKNSFSCECGKIYPYRSSLYNHKKKCVSIKTNNDIENNELKVLVCKLINENNEIKNRLIEENIELKKQLIDKDKQISCLIPKIGDNIIHNNINQTFNINFFLNEKCKDAINMNEFIEKIQRSINNSDFKTHKNLDKELNNLIIENINELGIFKRPLHCTDVKKETLYIKDNNNWYRDENKDNIKKVIKNTSSHHYKVLNKWIDKNPDIQYDENKKDSFAKSLSVLGKDLDKSNTKLIKMICNNTYLNDKDIIDE